MDSIHHNPKVNGLIDTIFQNVDKYLPVALGVWGSTQQPKTGQAKGYAAIKAACDSILNQLQQLLSATGQVPEQQAIEAANNLRTVLDDQNQIYQAKRGDDGKYLADSKAKADDLINRIRAAYQQGTTTQTVVTTNQQGQLITQEIPVALNNLLNNENLLLYGGVAVGTLLALKILMGGKK